MDSIPGGSPAAARLGCPAPTSAIPSDRRPAALPRSIALTSPRDASRCAAVSPSFRAAADSDHVWRRFIPSGDAHFLLQAGTPATPGRDPASSKKKRQKDAYLGLCDAASVPAVGEDGGCRVCLDRATGAKCYALSMRRLSLPWDDGEFSWRFTPHPLSRNTCASITPPGLNNNALNYSC